MTIPTSVTELPGFPYSSFDEFIAAVRRDDAFLSVDQAFAIQWVQLSVSSGGAAIALLHGFLSWGMIWIGLVAGVLAWGDLGLLAFGMVVVSFLAAALSRPWRGGWLNSIAIVLLLYGWAYHVPVAQWIGATWAATYFLFRLMYADATQRFTSDLLANERQLAAALTPTPTQQARTILRRGAQQR